MRTLLRNLFGFALAVLAAGATEVLFALPPVGMARGSLEAMAAWLPEAAVLTLAAATHSAIFSCLFALVAILIGEWLGRRQWTFYVLTGIMIGLGGFLSEYAAENASQPTIVNNYALTAFVTAGAVGGLVFWLIAGRFAGRRGRSEGRSIARGEEGTKIDGSDAWRRTTEGAKGAGVVATGPATSVPTAGAPRRPSPLRAALDAADREPLKPADA